MDIDLNLFAEEEHELAAAPAGPQGHHPRSFEKRHLIRYTHSIT